MEEASSDLCESSTSFVFFGRESGMGCVKALQNRISSSLPADLQPSLSPCLWINQTTPRACFFYQFLILFGKKNLVLKFYPEEKRIRIYVPGWSKVSLGTSWASLQKRSAVFSLPGFWGGEPFLDRRPKRHRRKRNEVTKPATCPTTVTLSPKQ